MKTPHHTQITPHPNPLPARRGEGIRNLIPSPPDLRGERVRVRGALRHVKSDRRLADGQSDELGGMAKQVVRLEASERICFA